MQIDENRRTIAVILSIVLPGSGHIYLGDNYRNYGIKVSILFVIVTYLSNSVIFPIVLDFLDVSFSLNFSNFLFAIISPIQFLPVFIIWYKQLRNILRIINTNVMTKDN